MTPGFGPEHQPLPKTPTGASPTVPRIRDRQSPRHHACSAKRQTAWDKTAISNNIRLDIHRWAYRSALKWSACEGRAVCGGVTSVIRPWLIQTSPAPFHRPGSMTQPPEMMNKSAGWFRDPPSAGAWSACRWSPCRLTSWQTAKPHWPLHVGHVSREPDRQD